MITDNKISGGVVYTFYKRVCYLLVIKLPRGEHELLIKYWSSIIMDYIQMSLCLKNVAYSYTKIEGLITIAGKFERFVHNNIKSC